jgi:ankyrin repeat protein
MALSVRKVSNIQNANGETPLHFAAKRGHIKIVQCLIDLGADENISDKAGRMPWHVIKTGYRSQLGDMLKPTIRAQNRTFSTI